MNLEEPVISVNGQEYQRRENVETFLLLGQQAWCYVRSRRGLEGISSVARI